MSARNSNIISEHGFTLMELMISIAMLAVLSGVILYWEIGNTERFYSEIYRREMVEAANRSLEWIARDLRTSLKIGLSENGHASSPLSIVIETAEKQTVIYEFDPKARTLTRFCHETNQPTIPPIITRLADHVDMFAMIPYHDTAPLFDIEIHLSRSLLKEKEIVRMNRIAARRIQ